MCRVAFQSTGKILVKYTGYWSDRILIHWYLDIGKIHKILIRLSLGRIAKYWSDRPKELSGKTKAAVLTKVSWLGAQQKGCEGSVVNPVLYLSNLLIIILPVVNPVLYLWNLLIIILPAVNPVLYLLNLLIIILPVVNPVLYYSNLWIIILPLREGRI